MSTGKKIIWIIIDLFFLTLVIPTAWDYYSMMNYGWMINDSSQLPLVGEYLPTYLFAAYTSLAILLLLGLLFIAFYPKNYIDISLAAQGGELTVKRSAIEGFVREKISETQYLKAPTINVILHKNSIDIEVRGEIIPRVQISEKAQFLEAEISQGLKNFFGLEQKVKLNVEVTTINTKDNTKRLRVV